MHKPIALAAAACCVITSFAQQTDTLVIYYKPDQYQIATGEKSKLDSFLAKAWDRVSINGYTDETETDEYNIDLSRKRSSEVYRYFISRNLDSSKLSSQFFGESVQIADQSTDGGRALNRRTVIIGYIYPRVAFRPVADPMKPVTTTLPNGIMLTYRPGTMSEDLAGRFGDGSGSGISVLTNTIQMRQNNLYNNTTNGEILSSVMILCYSGYNPCKLDSPVLLRVPLPYKTKCPLSSVRFFNAVVDRGVRIWQEQSQLVNTEEIDGRQYVSVWMDDFCSCINFDFKIDPECFDLDSTRLYTNATIRNLSAEVLEWNSMYLPRKINDSTRSIYYIKNKPATTTISFSLYKYHSRLKSFKNEPLSALPYDSLAKRYVIATGSYKFYFPRQKVWEMVLKVNNDKYRVWSDDNRYECSYLRRPEEKIRLDISLQGPKGIVRSYKDLPLESIVYDEKSGYYIIDKKLLKDHKAAGIIAKN